MYNGKMKIISKKNMPLVVILSVFFLFTVFLAFSIKIGISPDSFFHLEVSKIFSTTFGIPPNTVDSYQWRDITRLPYLYFWINGRILNLNSLTFNVNEVFLLRFVNILYSVGTLIFTYLISKEYIKNKWGQLLPTFLLANTLMFVFLSSSINYDNLTNLLCTGSIYFFVKYLKESKELKYSIYLWIFLLLASLTKDTVLPLAFVMVLIWFVVLIRRKILNKDFCKQFLKTPNIILLTIFTVLIGLNISLYGVNVITYGKLSPGCTDILTHEQCLQNGVYYREIYKIPTVFEGNVKEGVQLILKGERVDPISYLPFWMVEISKKVFGIMGDQSLYMKYEYLPFYGFYFFLGVFLVLKNRKKLDTKDKALLLITAFYLAVLYFYHNYNTYFTHNWKDLALQGRYIFPVLTPIYVVLSKYFFEKKNKKLLKILSLILILGFILGCIPYFLIYVPSGWYM